MRGWWAVAEEPADFAGLLRLLREHAALTQEELAEAARVGLNTVSDLERGRHQTCQKQTAQRLADAFGLAGHVRDSFVAAARGLMPVATALAGGQLRQAPGGRPAAGPAQPAWAGPAPPPPLEIRYSLPPDTASFTGRDAELNQITAAVSGAQAAGAVITIDGMPGVGKTALAVHVAHRLRGRFPDRQLFIDLHAHTPGQEPVPAEVALAGLLTAAGVDARYLPEEVAARSSLWRDRMAGQRALLVLDNAESSRQVAPLLPGGENCRVLVTSRRHLGDLPGAVVPVQVEVLPPEMAEEMFLRLAPRAAPGPEVAELVRLAGYLPLAISLLARVYARHTSWTLADLTAETTASMLTLAAENNSVAAAFEISYRYLAPGQQQFLRRLGLHLGAVIDVHAAAALAGISQREAAAHLDALHREALLTEAGYRRYGMHDLIRRYARERAEDDPVAGRAQARKRLLDFYTHAAAAAQARLARQTRPGPAPAAPQAAVPDLPDRSRALGWARAERANLLACLDYAAETGQHSRVVALTAAMSALLQHDGPWAEAIGRHTRALSAARRLHDRPGQASALSDLAAVRRLSGEYSGAARALEEALGLYRNLGDRLGQANALTDLGVVRRLMGGYPAATGALEEALGLYRDLGDRLGQANALKDLGPLRRMTGDLQGAAQALEEALALYRAVDGQPGQANALNYLGVVRSLAGQYQEAAQALEEALGLYRDLGDRLGQANALNDLGDVWRATGNYQQAARAQEEALAIYRDLGSRLGQANALNYLGVVRRLTGEYQDAVKAQEEALAIYRDLGSRLGQANALSYLGVVRRLTGEYSGAARALEEALAIYRDLGDRGGEVEVLNESGTLHRLRGNLGQAGQYHRRALALARETDGLVDTGHSLAGLGRCELAAGKAGEARTLLRQAQEIFDRTGSAEAAVVAAELDALDGRAPS